MPDAPDAEFWEDYYADNELKLPSGEYNLNAYCDFGLSERDFSYENKIEIKFEVIGEKENRSKGYGSEAMELLISYGFKVLNLNNILLLRIFRSDKIKSGYMERLKTKKIGRLVICNGYCFVIDFGFVFICYNILIS